MKKQLKIDFEKTTLEEANNLLQEALKKKEDFDIALENIRARIHCEIDPLKSDPSVKDLEEGDMENLLFENGGVSLQRSKQKLLELDSPERKLLREQATKIILSDQGVLKIIFQNETEGRLLGITINEPHDSKEGDDLRTLLKTILTKEFPNAEFEHQTEGRSDIYRA